MEDKIREVLTSEIGLSGCGESEITGLNETVEKLLMVFEQEKQAYAREMCNRAFKRGFETFHGTRYEHFFDKFAKENFPEK